MEVLCLYKQYFFLFFSERRLVDETVLRWGFPPQERARELFRTMNEFSHWLCCLFRLLAHILIYLLGFSFQEFCSWTWFLLAGAVSVDSAQLRSLSEVSTT